MVAETVGRNVVMPVDTIASSRQGPRDSLFLSAKVAVCGGLKPVAVRVRNLSVGGMMVDSNAIFHEGSTVLVELRGIGAVPGQIVWIVEDRAGISFDKEIDPMAARAPVAVRTPHMMFTPQPHRSRRPGLKLR